MAKPTITTTGAAGGLFLITDQDGVVYRVPKTSLGTVIDSSNSRAHRVEIFYNGGVIVLLFDAAEDVAAFIAAVDAQY